MPGDVTVASDLLVVAGPDKEVCSLTATPAPAGGDVDLAKSTTENSALSSTIGGNDELDLDEYVKMHERANRPRVRASLLKPALDHVLRANAAKVAYSPQHDGRYMAGGRTCDLIASGPLLGPAPAACDAREARAFSVDIGATADVDVLATANGYRLIGPTRTLNWIHCDERMPSDRLEPFRFAFDPPTKRRPRERLILCWDATGRVLRMVLATRGERGTLTDLADLAVWAEKDDSWPTESFAFELVGHRRLIPRRSRATIGAAFALEGKRIRVQTSRANGLTACSTAVVGRRIAMLPTPAEEIVLCCN